FAAPLWVLSLDFMVFVNSPSWTRAGYGQAIAALERNSCAATDVRRSLLFQDVRTFRRRLTALPGLHAGGWNAQSRNFRASPQAFQQFCCSSDDCGMRSPGGTARCPAGLLKVLSQNRFRHPAVKAWKLLAWNQPDPATLNGSVRRLP